MLGDFSHDTGKVPVKLFLDKSKMLMFVVLSNRPAEQNIQCTWQPAAGLAMQCWRDC